MSLTAAADEKASASGKLLQDSDIIFAGSGAKTPVFDADFIKRGTQEDCSFFRNAKYYPHCGAKMDGKE